MENKVTNEMKNTILISELNEGDSFIYKGNEFRVLNIKDTYSEIDYALQELRDEGKICISLNNGSLHVFNDSLEVEPKLDIKYNLSFIDDWEKMYDFICMKKEDFLDSYSYLSEEEYEATLNEFEWKNIDAVEIAYKAIAHKYIDTIHYLELFEKDGKILLKKDDVEDDFFVWDSYKDFVKGNLRCITDDLLDMGLDDFYLTEDELNFIGIDINHYLVEQNNEQEV